MTRGLLVLGAPRSAMGHLARVLAQLPADLTVPVVVVVHREAEDERVAALAQACALTLVEPDDKQELQPARVYLAPCGYHLLVDSGRVCLSLEPPEHGERPSIDALFESAADAYDAGVTALLLPGHEDGWWGLARVCARGGRTAVLDPELGADTREGERAEGAKGELPLIGLEGLRAWLNGPAHAVQPQERVGT